MTTILAILALAVLFALFGLVMMRGRQGGCGRECSCAPLGRRACGASDHGGAAFREENTHV